MNWKFSGAAIITLFILTLNAQSTTAQTNVEPSIQKASLTTGSTAGSSILHSKNLATIIVRVVDPSGVPVKQQALVQLLADGNATPVSIAFTSQPAYAKFQAEESHTYVVQASAAGYETAELHLQTYRHDDYYQAILRLQPKPAAKADPPPLSPAAAEQAEKGLTAFESANYEAAAKRFRAAVELAPQNADLNFLLGVSLFESH